MTDRFEGGRTYFDVEIEGRSPDTEFGLGTTCYPIHLRENVRLTQGEIEAGPVVRTAGGAVS